MKSSLATFDADSLNGEQMVTIGVVSGERSQGKVKKSRPGHLCIYFSREREAKAKAKANQVTDGNLSAYISHLIDMDAGINPSTLNRLRLLSQMKDQSMNAVLSSLIDSAVTRV